MNSLYLRSDSLRFTLCAAITCFALTASSARAQESKSVSDVPSASEMLDVPSTSEMYDEDFAKHVDLRVLGVAWQSLDSKMMTDVALQLREAESVLGRKHPKITSERVLALASKVAADSEDNETLERLARVAEASGNGAEIAKMKQFKSLSAKSRDLKGDLKSTPMFSANDVNNGALAAFSNILLQIRAAKVSGDRVALESLAEGTDLLSSLQSSHRSRLRGLIDDAVETVGDPDDSVSAIHKLTGVSRDLGNASSSWAPSAVSSQMPTKAGLRVGVGMTPPSHVRVGVAITPPSSGGPETSYAAGGMRYVMTPAGAVVQSHGRLGSILFEPGDVIMALGGYPLSIGTTVDSAINAGYLSSFRQVSVRDRNSGGVVTLYY